MKADRGAGESAGRPLGCEVARALGVIFVARWHLEPEAKHADLQAHFKPAKRAVNELSCRKMQVNTGGETHVKRLRTSQSTTTYTSKR